MAGCRIAAGLLAGVTLAMLNLTAAAQQRPSPPPPPPAIDCASPKHPAERAICTTAKLDKWEKERHEALKRIWDRARTNRQRALMRRQHTEWEMKRNRCGLDRSCLSRIYTEKLNELQVRR
ncbi:MAG: hypothetical protein F9K44_01530 [Hyphomicrobiaceae bacterium]|nr:MAG: hypothetical protein F9K44_01530 [Hyphomicrobiaceae bacterium]